MNTLSPATRYDRYWQTRDLARAEARSRRRARLAVGLLGSRRGALLEVGCGPGWALEVFRESGFEVRGLDLSEVAVEAARGRGLDVVQADFLASELRAEADIVVALEVLEHVLDPLLALGRLAGAVRPGGRLLVSLPNEWHLLQRLRVLAGRPSLGGHDDPHLRHFGLADARRLLRAAGLCVEASAWDGLAPPRWRALKRLSEPLASLWPGLFAISGVHLLAFGGSDSAGAGDGVPSPGAGRPG